MLEDLEWLITWARMQFKPPKLKSRRPVLNQGKVQNQFKFKVGGQEIPKVTEKPVKSLGEVVHSRLA